MSDTWRERVATILEIIARDRLPNPHDLDVALDAIECEVSELVEAARRDEREACATVCQKRARAWEDSPYSLALSWRDEAECCAAAIRARGDA
jgi:hypothetical protein